MKSFFTGLLAAPLIVFAAAAHAAELDELYLEQCESQVGQRYGEGHEIKLVSMRRSSRGAIVKVAVRLNTGTAETERVEFTSCQVSREAIADGQLDATSREAVLR
jgi:hypothetical protein